MPRSFEGSVVVLYVMQLTYRFIYPVGRGARGRIIRYTYARDLPVHTRFI